VVLAGHALFQDMCAVVAGDDLRWLAAHRGLRRVSIVLALEVVDDGLAGNAALFSAARAPAFASLLSSRLCPAVHELLCSNADRHVLKALFGLVVNVLRTFWRDLGPDSEVLLSCLTKIVDFREAPAELPWSTVYAMEALCAILRDGVGSHGGDETPSILVSMFRAFDFQPSSSANNASGVMSGLLQAACRSGTVCARSDSARIASLPLAPLGLTFKPFSVSAGNRYNLYVSAATGVCLAYCNAVRASATAGDVVIVSAMMEEATARGVLQLIGFLLLDAPLTATVLKTGDTPISFLNHVTGGLASAAFAADKASIAYTRALVMSSLGLSATVALRRLVATGRQGGTPSDADGANGGSTGASRAENGGESVANCVRRVLVLYQSIFKLERTCGERFGPAWRDFVNAVEALDVGLYGELLPDGSGESPSASSSAAESSSSPSIFASLTPFAPALAPLKEELEASFAHASSLSWMACGDLVGALVASSRASLAALSKRCSDDDTKPSKISSSTRLSSERRIFGIARSETVMASIFAAPATSSSGTMPHGVWQLLTGHLVAVASDSSIYLIRLTAIRSLVRVASCALESEMTDLVPQDKVVAPFTDILSSSHADARQGCLDAVYTLLETRGERLKGSGAWANIFAILRTASGARSSPVTTDSAGVANFMSGRNSVSDAIDVVQTRGKTASTSSSVPGEDPATAEANVGEAMVQRGFRGVQLIADDFLSFLAFETLSQWVSLLRLYCQQGEDVNVALTAVGLLWRTADHFAKHCGEGVYDSLWMELFEVLRAVGRDERPEVRNGAVKTLTSTLTAHGTKLTAVAWKGCVERALLPLLEEVMNGGSLPSSGNITGTNGTGGRSAGAVGSRGKNEAQLVLHHSRDTPRKQWNETRVLALGGVATVLRKAMPKLVSLYDTEVTAMPGQSLLLMLADGGSNGLWAKVLRAAGNAACSAEREVASAGVAALFELLNAAGSIMGDKSTPAGAVELWHAVWAAIENTVRNDNGVESECIMNENALVALANGLGATRRDLDSCFTPRSTIALIRILADLACGASTLPPPPVVSVETMSLPRSGRGPGDGLTEVQHAAVAVIESLSFGSDEETSRALVTQLLAILKDRASTARTDPLLLRVLRLLASLYDGDRMPGSVKSGELSSVMAALGDVLRHQQENGTFHDASFPNASVPLAEIGRGRQQTFPSSESPVVAPPSPLAPTVNGLLESEDVERVWISAVDTLSSVLVRGLSAGPPLPSFWPTLHRVLSDFLYSPGRQRDLDGAVELQAAEALAMVEQFDIKLARCTRDALGFVTDNVDKEMQTALVGLLARGAQEGMHAGRPKFVRVCQESMFSLADASPGMADRKPDTEKHIAEQAAGCVVKVSDSVLGKFVADGQRAGKCPLPAERRAEAVFLLRRLQALRVSTNGDADARRHLRTLHPRLCECVDKASDDAVRLLAAATIQSTS
jgi:hypothetical protein